MSAFDPELVLTDDEAFRFDSAFDASGFLLRQGSVLGRATWPDGTSRPELSTSAVLKQSITERFPHANPNDDVCAPPYCSLQLLLASLQREQSLVTLGPTAAAALRVVPTVIRTQLRKGYGNPATLEPADAFRTVLTNRLWYRFDWCLGYGALDRPARDKPFPPKWEWWRGFSRQVRAAARRYKELAYEWKPGRVIEDLDAKEAGGARLIVPRNMATWALWRYTPRESAQRLTFSIFRRFGFLGDSRP